MENASCRICKSRAHRLFVGRVLKVHNVEYFRCESCGFVQTEEPWWLAEAYTSAINDSDTGLVGRNILNVRKTAVALYFLFDPLGSFLDYGGGWGLFTRMMRDTGFDFYWHDAHCENLFARGFALNATANEFDVITAFEVFEHFADPLAEVDQMVKLGKNIVFSTMLLPDPVPALNDWWYYSPEHGQHISFYSKKSLMSIGRKMGLHFASDNRDFHVLSTKPISQLRWQMVLKSSRISFPVYVRRAMKGRTMGDMHGGAMQKGLAERAMKPDMGNASYSGREK